MKKCFFLLAGSALLLSCSHKSNIVTISTTSTSTTSENVISPGTPVPLENNIMNSRPNLARLRATLFKMSGNYANNVAVTLDANGNLIYFPAPTDLSAESVPQEVGEGWWLNRQGLGANSVFTKYTFEEYRALKTVPTPDEIKAAIIPGARVTEFRRLVLPASEARGLEPKELLKYLDEE